MIDYEQSLTALAGARAKAADLRHQIATHAIEGRLLRTTIEEELRKGGMAQTPAEKAAKADARYIAHERSTAGRERALAEAEADAECQRIRVLFQLAEVQADQLLGTEG